MKDIEKLRAKWRRGNARRRDQKTEYMAAWRAANPNYMQEWRDRHPGYVGSTPEKRRARQMVSRAIRSGRLERGDCEICGLTPTEAHHPFGYEEAMALAVWWLCRSHHLGVHRL